MRVQVWLDDGEPVASVLPVWPAADWFEREAWDMMGIRFEGHPNLVRILMDDDWEGHPLRKDYPLGGEPASPVTSTTISTRASSLRSPRRA